MEEERMVVVEVVEEPTLARVLSRLARRETKSRASLLSDSTQRRANAWVAGQGDPGDSPPAEALDGSLIYQHHSWMGSPFPWGPLSEWAYGVPHPVGRDPGLTWRLSRSESTTS